MKKLIPLLALAVVFAGGMLFADVPLNKKHKGLKGLEDASVNCAYCHTKAGNPKTGGNDLAKLKKGKYCAIQGCHK